MEKPACPHCGSTAGVRKWGRNRASTQRYRCVTCRWNFTPTPKEQGHGVATHDQAARLYLEGMSLRGIGRLLGVVHQSVANWVAAAAQLPERVTDATPTEPVEVDELFNLRGAKKRGDAFVVIAVTRESRLIVGQWVTAAFEATGMQAMADILPEASRYCIDG